MVKKKTGISSEVTEFLAMGIGFETPLYCICKGCRLGGFSRHADVVKMNGMIEFVFKCDDNHGIAWDVFLDGDVNAQKETNNKGTDSNNRNDLIFFPHSRRSRDSSELSIQECHGSRIVVSKAELITAAVLSLSLLISSRLKLGMNCRLKFRLPSLLDLEHKVNFSSSHGRAF